jgi:hypothetical protein
MTWCNTFKKAVRTGVIEHTDKEWLMEHHKIKFCPWCAATLTMDDF